MGIHSAFHTTYRGLKFIVEHIKQLIWLETRFDCFLSFELKAHSTTLLSRNPISRTLIQLNMGKCYNSTVINAQSDKVWNLLRDFHDMSWAKGVIPQVDTVGDLPADQPGAKRILNEVFHETLVELNDDEKYFVYSIDDSPGPIAKETVSNYLGKARVAPITATGASFVEWSSSYISEDDSAVGEFCDPIYYALLQTLKETCESE